MAEMAISPFQFPSPATLSDYLDRLSALFNTSGARLCSGDLLTATVTCRRAWRATSCRGFLGVPEPRVRARMLVGAPLKAVPLTGAVERRRGPRRRGPHSACEQREPVVGPNVSRRARGLGPGLARDGPRQLADKWWTSRQLPPGPRAVLGVTMMCAPS